jgi:nicotinamidase-related amidase
MPASQPHAQLLDRESTALMVLDLQEKLVPTMSDPAQTIRNAQILLRLAEILRIPIILTAQYVKGLGPIVPEILQSAPGVEFFEKTSFGCFGEPGFYDGLKRRAPQAHTLVVAGVESHICVTQTVLGALEAGYLVHVAADAVCSRTRENWRIGLKRMERTGAVISSTEMVVYELLARSGTQEFKEILQVLKLGRTSSVPGP